MKERIEKKRLAILRVLRDAAEPLPSNTITEELLEMGYDISPRTIRFHLKSMDDEGLTEYSEKHGRFITHRGIEELEAARVFEKVGFLNARIEQMAWRMNFDIQSQKGTVIINISFLRKTEADRAVELLTSVFKTGFTMGQLVRLYDEGEQIGLHRVPEGYIGLGTVCSFSFNGILTKEGIPIHSRFGGLLQIEKREPLRFVEIINYDGTSIDPLEIFIQSRMTDFSHISDSGSGRIGANFFEIPAEARRQDSTDCRPHGKDRAGKRAEAQLPRAPSARDSDRNRPGRRYCSRRPEPDSGPHRKRDRRYLARGFGRHRFRLALPFFSPALTHQNLPLRRPRGL